MIHLFSQYGLFILFLIIVAIVYIEARHNPKMLKRADEVAASDRTSTLIANIKDKKSLQDLKNLLPEIYATEIYNKATTKHAKKLNDNIWNEYYGQRYYLVCTEYPGLTQELLPFLIN